MKLRRVSKTALGAAITLLLAGVYMPLYGQKQVAITIDDVPASIVCREGTCYSPMLQTLDQLRIPVAIFVNEGKIYQLEPEGQGIKLLEQWISRKYTTVGNHTFGHTRYSELGLDSFAADIGKDSVLRALSQQYGKPVTYFRFPFNDLGKDSLQHTGISRYLAQHNYLVTPFTIESSDWAYNDVYEYWLRKNDSVQAASVAQAYIRKTMDYFAYFETISRERYGRAIRHIYLCHDNRLNAVCMPELLRLLKQEGYTFVSLEEAMRDEVYRQEDHYYKKFGISWIYRWMTDKEQAMRYLKGQPDVDTIEALRDSLMAVPAKGY